MALNFEEYKTKLYSAVLADTLDSLGFHKQTLSPGIKSIKPDIEEVVKISTNKKTYQFIF